MNLKYQSLKEGARNLEARVRSLLPLAYHSCLDSISPTSMGSAGLKYSPDGKVAWDEIWTSFCDLALAGGPPHRGKLLPPTDPAEAIAFPDLCTSVAIEIQRGILLTTELTSSLNRDPGWICLPCESEHMAAWLHRAIMAENVFVTRSQNSLLLPAGPKFHLAKEIKNVIVAVAKTYHYWNGHMSPGEQARAGRIMMDSLLLEPLLKVDAVALEQVARLVSEALGLPLHPCEDLGWVGLVCSDDRMAAWMVRSAIAMNILARRRNNILYLPVFHADAGSDLNPRVREVLSLLRQIWDQQRELGEA